MTSAGHCVTNGRAARELKLKARLPAPQADHGRRAARGTHKPAPRPSDVCRSVWLPLRRW